MLLLEDIVFSMYVIKLVNIVYKRSKRGGGFTSCTSQVGAMVGALTTSFKKKIF